jgi:hypothetical protein
MVDAAHLPEKGDFIPLSFDLRSVRARLQASGKVQNGKYRMTFTHSSFELQVIISSKSSIA